MFTLYVSVNFAPLVIEVRFSLEVLYNVNNDGVKLSTKELLFTK